MNKPVVVRSSDNDNLWTYCAFLSSRCFHASISQVVNAVKENSYIGSFVCRKNYAVNLGKNSYKTAHAHKSPGNDCMTRHTMQQMQHKTVINNCQDGSHGNSLSDCQGDSQASASADNNDTVVDSTLGEKTEVFEADTFDTDKSVDDNNNCNINPSIIKPRSKARREIESKIRNARNTTNTIHINTTELCSTRDYSITITRSSFPVRDGVRGCLREVMGPADIQQLNVWTHSQKEECSRRHGHV